MPFPAKTSADEIALRALDLIRNRGLEGLSMRQLADKLGIKAPSLYRHFPDRASLESELGGRAAALLLQRMHAIADGKRTTGKLRAAAREYVEFSRDEPALFQLLLRAPASGSGKELWNYLLEVIGEITGDKDDTAATVAIWSFLHGFVTLERSRAFGESGPQGALDRGLNALIRGLSAK